MLGKWCCLQLKLQLSTPIWIHVLFTWQTRELPELTCEGKMEHQGGSGRVYSRPSMNLPFPRPWPQRELLRIRSLIMGPGWEPALHIEAPHWGPSAGPRCPFPSVSFKLP